MRSRVKGASDGLLEAINGWLASPRGFYQAFLGSLLWVPLVLIGFDQHGFYYLYVATLISFVGTFNLAIFARRSGEQATIAAIRAEASDAKFEVLLVQHGEILRRVASSDESMRALLEGVAVSLENQQHVIDAIVELSKRDVALGASVEGAVSKIHDGQQESSDRHLENQRMISEGLEVVRLLYETTRPIGDAAVARGEQLAEEEPADDAVAG